MDQPITQAGERADRRYDDPAMRQAYAEGMEFAEKAAGAMTATATRVSEPLAACPVCAGTWWNIARSARIAAGEIRAAAVGAEPVIVENRVTVACASCGAVPF